jgi:DNA modification methylase
MPSQQLELPIIQQSSIPRLDVSYRKRLSDLLSSDLDFHDKSSAYASHNFHAFPAKFPPQLPKKFIEGLTEPGDVVLDPMMGSGTTILEAFLAGRRGIGFDIDPMALRLCKVKVTPSSTRSQIEKRMHEEYVIGFLTVGRWQTAARH